MRSRSLLDKFVYVVPGVTVWKIDLETFGQENFHHFYLKSTNNKLKLMNSFEHASRPISIFNILYSGGRVLRDRGLRDKRALIGWKWRHAHFEV